MLVLVLAVPRWIERIPEPVLAAIVIHAVSKSLRLSVFRNYFRWRRDRLVAVAAVLAVMIFGVLNGLLAAIALSHRAAAALAGAIRAYRSSGASVSTTIVSVGAFPRRVRCRACWCCARRSRCSSPTPSHCSRRCAQQVLRQPPAAKLVVLSLEESPDLDSTSLEVLGEFCNWLAGAASELRLARLKDTAREALARGRISRQLPADCARLRER